MRKVYSTLKKTHLQISIEEMILQLFDWQHHADFHRFLGKESFILKRNVLLHRGTKQAFISFAIAWMKVDFKRLFLIDSVKPRSKLQMTTDTQTWVFKGGEVTQNGKQTQRKTIQYHYLNKTFIYLFGKTKRSCAFPTAFGRLT